MTSATRCDQCQTVGTNTLDDDMPYGWFAVTPQHVRQKYGEPREYHFCSWQCVREFAEERSGKATTKS